MDSLQSFRERLELLDSLLSQFKSNHARMKQLKRSVYVLRALLKNEQQIQSPYGPQTPIVRFSLQ